MGVNDLELFDPEVAAALKAEEKRQIEKIELIASENYVSDNVLRAAGSIFTNKYAEGYPGKRYYGGCENVDVIETLAIERSKALFGAEASNVQAHSGSQANMACYMALLKTGDKILGMNLSHGGHLTHGSKVNFSGSLYESVFYDVNQDGYIDYNQLEEIAKRERPKLIIAGFSAYSRQLDFEKFSQIAKSVDAFLLADVAHVAGLIAAGIYPNPVPYCDLVSSTTHKTLRGPRGGLVMGSKDLIKKVNSKIFPGIQGGPLCHVIMGKAIAFKEAGTDEFVAYAKQVVQNAKVLASELMANGYNVLTKGTDNHLMLIDFGANSLSGKEAEEALDLSNITVNKNTVPGETRSPFVTSGIRLGTAALTTRGMKSDDIKQVARFINTALVNYNKPEKLAAVASEVAEFCKKFPTFKF